MGMRQSRNTQETTQVESRQSGDTQDRGGVDVRVPVVEEMFVQETAYQCGVTEKIEELERQRKLFNKNSKIQPVSPAPAPRAKMPSAKVAAKAKKEANAKKALGVKKTVKTKKVSKKAEKKAVAKKVKKAPKAKAPSGAKPKSAPKKKV